LETLGHIPLGLGVVTPRNMLLHYMSDHANYGYSKSNHMSVVMEISII